MIAPVLRQRLLVLARSALEARVLRQPAPVVPDELNVPASGVFVTIRCAGDLRGCLGTLDERERLAEAVVRLAGEVAHEDYRFRPVAARELVEVVIDVSVLTPAERVRDPMIIEIGRDGLIVEQGSRRGLLLPQVAVEYGWDRETFLNHTCLKAGLRPHAWRVGTTTIWRFQADVFGEETWPQRYIVTE